MHAEETRYQLLLQLPAMLATTTVALRSVVIPREFETVALSLSYTQEQHYIRATFLFLLSQTRCNFRATNIIFFRPRRGESTDSFKSRVIRQRFLRPGGKGRSISATVHRWREDWSFTRVGGSPSRRKNGDRRTRGGYRRDKDGKLQAIWLIRLRDSNPGDRDAGTVYATPFDCGCLCRGTGRRKEYENGLEKPRGGAGGSGVRYIRTARGGRLGFCRGNPAELRKEGFLFMRQIDDTCTHTLLPHRHRIFSISPTALPFPFRPVCVSTPRSLSDGALINFFSRRFIAEYAFRVITTRFVVRNPMGFRGGPSSSSARHSDPHSDLIQMKRKKKRGGTRI